MASELLEILGLYYDSLEEQLLKEVDEQPKTVDIIVESKIRGIEHGSYAVEYKYVFKSSKLIQSDKHYYDFISFLNEVSPNFVWDLDSYDNLPVSSQNSFKIVCNERPMTLYSKDTGTLFETILIDYLGALGHLPTQYSLQISITRYPNIDYIKQWCAQARGIYFRSYASGQRLSTKQFAESILSNKWANSGWRCRRPYQFEGHLKNKLYHLDKETLVFVIEYLYGKKLSKTTDLRSIGSFLTNTEYNDFNIRDVQKLSKLCDVFTSHNKKIKDIYNQLVKLLPAKTDLKRWKKSLEVIQEAAKP